MHSEAEPSGEQLLQHAPVLRPVRLAFHIRNARDIPELLIEPYRRIYELALMNRVREANEARHGTGLDSDPATVETKSLVVVVRVRRPDSGHLKRGVRIARHGFQWLNCRVLRPTRECAGENHRRENDRSSNGNHFKPPGKSICS